MADEKIEVVLDLVDNMSVDIRGVRGELRRFNSDLTRLDSSLKRTESATRSSTRALRDWSIIIGQSRNVIHQLWYVTGQWVTSMIQTNAEIERMTRLMKGMSNAATDAERSMEAVKNVNTLFETAKNAPFTVNALSDSFVKFKSVGLDPLDGSMQSLVDAVAAFGGTDEILGRASIAIQQMAGKGVISMEELRQQLGEAVPQSITMMANAIGVSYGELVDAISKGTVEAKPALAAMFGAFELAFGGRAKDLMDTFNGRLAQLKTSWTELIRDNDGIQDMFESVKDAVSALTDFLGTQFASQIFGGIGTVVSSLVSVFTSAISNLDILYSRARGFIDMMINTVFTEDSFIAKVAGALTTAAKAAGVLAVEVDKLMKTFGESAIEAFTGLSPQEQADQSILERARNNSSFADDEYGNIIDLIDRRREELESRKDQLEGALLDVLVEAPLSVLDRVQAGGQIFDRADLEQGIKLAGALEGQRQILQDEMIKNINLADQLMQDWVDAMKAGDDVEASRIMAMRQGQSVLASEVRQEYLQVQEKLTSWNEQFSGLLAQIRERSKEVRYDAFGDVIQEETGELEHYANLAGTGIADALAEAAGSALTAREEIARINEELELLAGTADRELKEVSQNLAKPFIDQADDIREAWGNAFQDVMTENAALFQDDTLSTAEMTEQMQANNAAFIASQIEKFAELQSAAQVVLQAEGEQGMAAAAVFAEYISGLIASLQSQVSNYESRLGAGLQLVSGKPSTGGGGLSLSDQLDRMNKDAEREAEELKRRVVDPFAYELPNAIESARKKLDKLAEKFSGGQWTQAMQDTFDAVAMNAMTEEMLDMADATREIERSLMGERGARKEAFDEEVHRLRDMKNRLIEMGLWRVEWEQIIQNQIKALRDEMEAKSPLGEYLSEWKNIADDLQQVGVDAMQSISQSLADMVTEGKADFADLARSAVNSLLQISFNAGLSGLGDIIKRGITGAFGGGASTAPVNHSGAIVGSGPGRSRGINMSDFAGAARFHTGGIIGQEVPTILEKGEGVFTSEQMKALGANISGAKTTKVNIINNTSSNIEESEANVRMDPEGMVMDIVLKNAGSPGPFRDTLKRVLK